MNKFLTVVAAAALIGTIASAQDQGQGRRERGQGRGGFRGQMMGGMRGGGNEFGLVYRADVQKDLAISAEQKTKLDALRPQRGQGRGQGEGQGQGQGQRRQRQQGQQGQQGTPPTDAEREARRTEQRQRQENQQKELEAILTDSQKGRLKEISLQIRGTMAIVDPKVQSELSMTTAQKDQVTDLMTKFRAATQGVMEKARNQELTQEQARELATKNQNALKGEIAKILTSEQSDKLKAMSGKPFMADPQQGRRGGGGGGGK